MSSKKLKHWVLFFFISLLANIGFSADFKWGKVPSEHQELKSCEYQSEAGAVVLFDIGKMEVFYDRVWELKRHRRIKILDEEGVRQAADMFFNYYAKDHTENIVAIRAQTINGEEIIKVDKSNIHRVDLDDDMAQVRISFPDVRVGSILEVSYRFT